VARDPPACRQDGVLSGSHFSTVRKHQLGPAGRRVDLTQWPLRKRDAAWRWWDRRRSRRVWRPQHYQHRQLSDRLFARRLDAECHTGDGNDEQEQRRQREHGGICRSPSVVSKIATSRPIETGRTILLERTPPVPIGTIDAAICAPRSKHCVASLAFVEEHSAMCWHRLVRRVPARWTSHRNDKVSHVIHRVREDGHHCSSK
jgi:hypothetical protein